MDQRSKVEKLRAMATQSASPREAEVARSMLSDMGQWPPDDPPTTTAASPAPGWEWNFSTTSSTASFSVNFTFSWKERAPG